jgi:hypothetical protein
MMMRVISRHPMPNPLTAMMKHPLMIFRRRTP